METCFGLLVLVLELLTAGNLARRWAIGDCFASHSFPPQPASVFHVQRRKLDARTGIRTTTKGLIPGLSILLHLILEGDHGRSDGRAVVGADGALPAFTAVRPELQTRHPLPKTSRSMRSLQQAWG